MSIWDIIENNEVEWKKLGEVCEISTGKLNANAMEENGIYPFFTCNENPYKINKYAFDCEAIIISGNGSKVGHINYYKGKFNAYQRTYIVSNFTKNICVGYLLHYLKNSLKDYIIINSKKASIPYITLPVLSNFLIPLPPLETQEKIAEILDDFEKMCTELQTELQLRNKQYNYYKDLLLSEEKLLELSGVELETFELKEISYYSKERIDSQFLDENNYVGVENLLKDRKGKIVSSYVPNEGLLTKFSKNDVLIGNIRPYLKKIWFSDIEGGTNGDVLVIKIREEFKNRILPKYLYHILSSNDFFDYNISFSKGAKMPRGDKSKIMEYICFIPPLSIQTYIVSILDSFDSMVNDIRDGLPSEIELRQKQYEYYREKLFSFS